MQELNAPPLPYTQMDIARRAFEIFLAEGRPLGRDAAHWLQAERELAAQAQSRNAGQHTPAPQADTKSTPRRKGRKKTSR